MPLPRRLSLGLCALTAFAAGCDEPWEPPPNTPASVEQVPVDPQTSALGEQAQQANPQADQYADTDPGALTDFHATLDPHGRWVEDPTYGTVWAPNASEVGADFTPYQTAGHWVYDDDDYVWMSDYEWGWAPFHYGRWVLTDTGWVWIPGRVYAPAWVYWQMGYPGWGYVGWAPMYPSFIWRGGVAVGYVAVAPPAHFCYVPHAAVFAPSIGAHVVVGAQASVVAAHMGYAAGGGVVASAPAAGVAAHGPAPASLGIPPQNVAHAPPGDRSMAMAKGFARPSTATQLGAHPPAAHYAKPVTRPRGGGYHGGGFHGGGFHGGGHR